MDKSKEIYLEVKSGANTGITGFDISDDNGFLRISKEEKEISARYSELNDGKGQYIRLLGVTNNGDATFWTAMENYLKEKGTERMRLTVPIRSLSLVNLMSNGFEALPLTKRGRILLEKKFT